MALMEFEYGSKVLGMKAKSLILLPQRKDGDNAKAHPVLWLLHGASDDYTIWLRRTCIERYVESLGLAVVMPSVHLSRYENMAHGPRYFDYLAHELPEVLGGVFPLSHERADNAVAGLSMGGYGAMKLGLTLPERYAAIGCLSSGNLTASSHLSALKQSRASGNAPVMEAVYGMTDTRALMGNTTADLFAMAQAAEDAQRPLPRIFHACGTEDFLLENAQLTARWFATHPAFAYTYREGTGGHTWDFWDHWIKAFLAWLVDPRQR